MSLFFTAHNNKEGGIEKSFGRQKMLGTAKPSGVIFFGTKGEDRNSFVSIHRNKFAVQKQRISDGDMEKAHEGRQKTKEKGGTESKNKPYGLAGKDVFLSPRHQVAGEGTG